MDQILEVLDDPSLFSIKLAALMIDQDFIFCIATQMTWVVAVEYTD